MRERYANQLTQTNKRQEEDRTGSSFESVSPLTIFGHVHMAVWAVPTTVAAARASLELERCEDRVPRGRVHVLLVPTLTGYAVEQRHSRLLLPIHEVFNVLKVLRQSAVSADLLKPQWPGFPQKWPCRQTVIASPQHGLRRDRCGRQG